MPKPLFNFSWTFSKTKKAEPYTKNGYDLCVQCRAKTHYLTTTPIQQRLGYIEGAGQLCQECIVKMEQERMKGTTF